VNEEPSVYRHTISCSYVHIFVREIMLSWVSVVRWIVLRSTSELADLWIVQERVLFEVQASEDERYDGECEVRSVLYPEKEEKDSWRE
jgi:hypothetical protein